MYKALLFDLDGTLSETDSVHFPAWANLLRPHGYDVDWNFFRENLSGKLNPEVVATYLPQLSEEEGRRIVEAKEEDFRGRVETLEPLPGLLDFIEYATDAGMEISLVTNAPKPNVLAVLRALGLEDAFDPIVVADDVEAGKPHPAPYLKALERLGVEAGEALTFEDSPSGISAAVAAGVPTVGVASTHDPKKLEEAGAFAVVYDFTGERLKNLLSGNG